MPKPTVRPVPPVVRIPLSPFQLQRFAELGREIATLTAMRDAEARAIAGSTVADPNGYQLSLEGATMVCTPAAPPPQ